MTQVEKLIAGFIKKYAAWAEAPAGKGSLPDDDFVSDLAAVVAAVRAEERERAAMSQAITDTERLDWLEKYADGIGTKVRYLAGSNRVLLDYQAVEYRGHTRGHSLREAIDAAIEVEP